MELEQQRETEQHLMQAGLASHQAERASERNGISTVHKAPAHSSTKLLPSVNEALATISKQLEQQTLAWGKEKGELKTTWKQSGQAIVSSFDFWLCLLALV